MADKTPTGGKNPDGSYDTPYSDSDGKSTEDKKNPEGKDRFLEKEALPPPYVEVQQQENRLNEERIIKRVVEGVVKHPRFKSIIQTREVSVPHVESVDNRMENTTTLHRCEICSCKRRCSCKCHFHRVKHDPTTEGNSKKKHEDTFKRTEKKNVGGNQGKKNLPVKENSSEDCVSEMLQGATGGNPEDQPSDGNYSGDFHKNIKYKKKQKDARRRKQKWVIDAAAWKSCIEDDDNIEAQAATLLEQRKLPDQVILNMVYANKSLAPQILQDICHHISNYIKDQSQLVLSVWAAYTFTKDTESYGNDIIFVLLIEGTNNVVVNDFSTHQRCINEVRSKEENLEISLKESTDFPTPVELQGLEKCLKENAKSLMNKHSKLTRVTASWFRAGVNEAGHRLLRNEHCIVLYVHIKGYVPLNEEPFPTKIGDYPVDVREGVLTLCGGPKDYHKNVKMGCSMGGDRQGTLGAFVEFDGDNNVYCLACAHVVFGEDKLKRISESNALPVNEVVYQPASKHEVAPFGKSILALYKEGGPGCIGMEIALIRVNEDRLPIEGSFPDDSNYTTLGFGPDKPFVFCSGTYLPSLDCFYFPEVFKYGCESKLTKGMCRLNGASVRHLEYTKSDFKLTLHNQLEIFPLEGNHFAVDGDSGALVLTNEINSNELLAVGVLEGEMENVCVVTPIYAILDELGRCTDKQCALKRFQPYRLRSVVNGSDGNLNEKVTSLTTTVTQVHENVEKIKHDLAKDLAAHKDEIREQLRKQSEEQERRTNELKEHQTKQSKENQKQTQELKEQLEKQLKNQTEQIIECLRAQQSTS